MATKNNTNYEVVSEDVTQIQTPEKRKKGKMIFILFFLATLGGLIYSQYELYKLKDPAYQQKVATDETNKIIAKVSKLILLPDEAPQVVIVQDVEKLRPLQPFFKDADNGDYVLIYQNIALIYSPTKNKLINVGPITREETYSPKATSSDTIKEDKQ